MDQIQDAPIGAIAPLRLVTVETVIEALHDAVAKAGSQRAFCLAHGVFESDLSSALRRQRPPTKALMRAVGVMPALVQRNLPLRRIP